MRTAALFGTMLVLATASVAAQTATGIHLADVRFSGDTQLDAVDLSKCAADLKSRTYEGPVRQVVPSNACESCVSKTMVTSRRRLSPQLNNCLTRRALISL